MRMDGCRRCDNYGEKKRMRRRFGIRSLGRAYISAGRKEVPGEMEVGSKVGNGNNMSPIFHSLSRVWLMQINYNFLSTRINSRVRGTVVIAIGADKETEQNRNLVNNDEEGLDNNDKKCEWIGWQMFGMSSSLLPSHGSQSLIYWQGAIQKIKSHKSMPNARKYLTSIIRSIFSLFVCGPPSSIYCVLWHDNSTWTRQIFVPLHMFFFLPLCLPIVFVFCIDTGNDNMGTTRVGKKKQ